MAEAPAKSELDEKFEAIQQQPGIKVVDQGYLANADETVRLEVARIPGGVQLIYVNPANEPIVEPIIRRGLVDILFDVIGQTTVTFVFNSFGYWSALRLYSHWLLWNSRGPYQSREALLDALDIGDE